MTYEPDLLEVELASYSAAELPALADTVSILLEAVDDGSTHYHIMRWRIESALAAAIQVRLAAEREAGRTAAIVPFPGKPK